MTKKIKSIKKYLKNESIKNSGSFDQVMKANHVRHVFFIHGTFVGKDSFGIINFLSPLLGPIVSGRLEILAKQGMDLVMDDVANYTDRYVEEFKALIGGKIGCQKISWNGGNYHLARLKGTLDLIDAVAKQIKQDQIAGGGHIWLIGHSHAGQLIALLTIFLSESAQADKLWKITDVLSHKENHYDIKKLKKNLRQIIKSNVHFDIVTFGTPPRYPWGKCDNYSLIHVINEHSDDLSNVSISDLLSTRDGDYVYQWGGTGTDFIAPSAYENDLNRQLDDILKDKSHDLAETLKKLKTKQRIIPGTGKTVLVDYGDKSDSAFRPNCINTMFGHGWYTRYKFLHFNTLLLVNGFYGKKKAR